jgi:hypothetical protein
MTDEEALDLAWHMFVDGKVDPTRTGTDDDKKHAAYHFQVRNLNLAPHMDPPCFLIDETEIRECDRQAFKILKRLHAAGISPWHPDPLKALHSMARLKNRSLKRQPS